MKLTRYRKAIAAVIGVGAMIALRELEIELPGFDAIVRDIIVGAFVSWGVYRVPNDA